MTTKKKFQMTAKSLDHPDVQAELAKPGKPVREDSTMTFLAMCREFLTPQEREDAAQYGRQEHEAAMKKLAGKKVGE